MKAQADVTDALRRTMALMQSELERSVLSTQMLGKCVRPRSHVGRLTCVSRGFYRFTQSYIVNSRRTYWFARHLEAACHCT